MTEDIRAEIPHLRKGLAACPGWVEEEFAGIPEARMGFAQQEPPWARWPPEVQLRHMAMVPVRWLVEKLGEALQARGYAYPPFDAAALWRGTGRHVPREVCPDKASLLAFMRSFLALAADILDRESPEGLRAVTCLWVVDPETVREDGAAIERPIDFWRMAARLHPVGVREDPRGPGRFTVELIAALRQIYWEFLAHIRTTQRLKGLLGLPARVKLPVEGYLTVPKFYD